jgi:hypothetical protein
MLPYNLQYNLVTMTVSSSVPFPKDTLIMDHSNSDEDSIKKEGIIPLRSNNQPIKGLARMPKGSIKEKANMASKAAIIRKVIILWTYCHFLNEIL